MEATRVPFLRDFEWSGIEPVVPGKKKQKKKKKKRKIQRDQFNSVLRVARFCVFSVLAKSEDLPRGSIRSLIYVKLINRSICPFSRLCSAEFRRNNARDTDRSNFYELLLENSFNWATIYFVASPIIINGS